MLKKMDGGHAVPPMTMVDSPMNREVPALTTSPVICVDLPVQRADEDFPTERTSGRANAPGSQCRLDKFVSVNGPTIQRCQTCPPASWRPAGPGQ